MPVSRGKDLRDANLRRAIELCMPGVNTMQGLNAYCAAPAPYPSCEGETQKNAERAKEEVVCIKGREFSSDLKIDTIDNPMLARIIVSHQEPLEIKEGEMVEPIGVRKNKTYVECRYVAPTQKARQQMLASIEMEDAPKGQRSVRDILNVMHEMTSTLSDIGIRARTAEALRAAKLGVWKVMLQCLAPKGARKLKYLQLDLHALACRLAAAQFKARSAPGQDTRSGQGALARRHTDGPLWAALLRTTVMCEAWRRH